MRKIESNLYAIWRERPNAADYMEADASKAKIISIFVQPGGPETFRIYDGDGKDAGGGFPDSDNKFGIYENFHAQGEDPYWVVGKLDAAGKKKLKDEFGINA